MSSSPSSGSRILALVVGVILASSSAVATARDAPTATSQAAEPSGDASEPTSTTGATPADIADDPRSRLDEARQARKSAPSAESWRAEAQALEELGQLSAAAEAYTQALELAEDPAVREALQADRARVSSAARGTVPDEPESTHREELDARWAPPRPEPEPEVTPEPDPAPPPKERIVKKWYFWVTVAAIAASAAAVTGIAIQAARDERDDDLDRVGPAPRPLPGGATVLRF